MRFFFYGTLMDPDVLRIVLGRDPPAGAAGPAELADYRRVCARGRGYPLLAPAASEMVAGVLVRNLAEADAIRLTWYESGGDYDIVEKQVAPPRGRAVAAWVYLPRPGAMAPGGPWSLEQWRRRHKQAFLAAAAGSRGPTRADLATGRAGWRRRVGLRG